MTGARPHHVVVDWGTSSFRLWALDGDGGVLAERRSAEGAVAAAKTGFARVLEDHLAALGIGPNVPVMICGMAGSRAGWVEAAYLDAPCDLTRLGGQAIAVAGARRVRILPGVAQRAAGMHDVMRGEETLLLGLDATAAGLVCLPGTHSKWVRLAGGRVERFATFMTGEMFALLRAHSMLAAAVSPDAAIDPADAAFAGGVDAAFAAPAEFSGLLFRLRAEWLLAGTAPEAGLARLSGLLIGLELAGARETLGVLERVALVAAGSLAGLYDAALRIAGATEVTVHDAEGCVRRGLHAAATACFAGEEVIP